VASIRKALRDGQFGNRCIVNIKGRGYSFVGTVARFEDDRDGRSISPNFRGRPAARSLMRTGKTVAVAAGHDADVRLIGQRNGSRGRHRRNRDRGCLIAEQMLNAGLSVLMPEAGPRIDRGRIIENYRNMPPAAKS
jgi:hypothetical protein